MSGQEREIRLGVLWASPSQLRQLEAWAAAFGSVSARVEEVAEIALDRHDLYLVMMDADSQRVTELDTFVSRATPTPCLVVGTRDDETLVNVALAAGAADFLTMPSLDRTRFERAVQFGLGRRRALDALTARESCLVAARERDRQRLANMLHDGPLQDLIGARFLLGALGNSGATDDIQNSLQSVMQAVRSLCSELKPPALGPFGLEKALRAHMQSFQTREPDITMTLELDVDNQQIPEWARLALFRVFQAAVSNVATHAQASHIGVRLLLDKEQVRLTVADDGKGFALPASWLDFARTARYGFLTMQERVDALRGRMVVQSNPGSGTRVMVQAPLDQPPLPLPAYLLSTTPDSSVPDRNGPDRNG